MPRTWETDMKNYSGYQHQQYKSILNQVAFTKPADYYQLQLEVMTYLMENHYDDVYQTVYQLLTKGMQKDGTTRVINIAGYNDTLKAMKNGTGVQWNPAFPDQKADAIAKAVTEGFIDSLKENVLDVVLPEQIFNEALKRSAKKAEAGIN